MDYQKVIEQARTCIGPYCKACAVCNGRACKNTMPGPGAKGIGDVAIRNFQKWQEIRVNMDTICEKKQIDTDKPIYDGKTCSGALRTQPYGASAYRRRTYGAL